MTNKKEKILYINFIISYKCSLNCDYCSLTKEERKQTDFLEIKKFKLYFLQLINFYNKNNYDKLVISLTGDELHTIPNFLNWLQEALEIIENHVKNIPKENIKLKMHTNMFASKEFYLEQFKMLKDSKRFCEPEFETAYQAMYHSEHNEELLHFIIKNISGINYNSSMALRTEEDKNIIKHLPVDSYYVFSKMPKREKPIDKEINFIMVVKSKGIINGCGYPMDLNLFKLQDKNFCTDCPHESCVMLENINRI